MADFSDCHNVDDLRERARRYLPLPLFDFIDGGAEDEVAMRNNRAAFERIRFKPRTLVDVRSRSLGCTLLGAPAAAPVAIAPMGSLSAFAPAAELALARAAARAGVPCGVSTVSGATIEQLRDAAPDARLWFQLYMMQDERLNRRLVERAAAAGCDALLVTTDTHMPPKRERDRRSGFSLTLRKTPRNVARVLARPRWMWDILIRQGLPRAEMIAGEVPEVRDNISSTRYFTTQRRWAFDAADLRAMRKLWKGKLLVKGVMRADEAAAALEAGADGIVMSNHGGRNLESAAAPLEMLPEVIDAVGGRMHVLIDSGFRRGTDVCKALALGAEGVLFGRPAAFAVAAGGDDGVGHFLGLMKDEIDRTLGYLGCTAPDQLSRDLLLIDRAPPGRNEPGI
jgi:isopentenyl diphosphate isomerase/L-lactate dehydrogenase-like FMN-dependent dehydrogenase